MPSNKNYSSNMRKTFGLVADTSATPVPDQLEPGIVTSKVTIEPQAQEATPQSYPKATITPPGVSANLNAAPKATLKVTGRPRSIIERVPKTLAVSLDTDEALETLVREVQRWRGRGRGIPKVNQGELVDFAVEYLRRRIMEGAQTAEIYYLEQEGKEHSTWRE